MYNYIKNEYLDFANHHNNKINLIVHILAGTIYMTSLNILSRCNLLPFYTVFLLLTFENIESIFLSTILIYQSTVILYKYKYKYKINTKYLILIFILNCFIVPEISHLISREATVLNFNILSFNKLITNIIYFLPFSIKRFISII